MGEALWHHAFAIANNKQHGGHCQQQTAWRSLSRVELIEADRL
jgi:hypothetical protein